MLKLAPPVWALVYVLFSAVISWSLGWPKFPGVCTDNLNAGVAVMKSAQDGA